MKKLLVIVLVVFGMTSCQTYHFTPGGLSSGCGEWHPKKFEKDRRVKNWRIRNNPNSAYNRHGRGW